MAPLWTIPLTRLGHAHIVVAGAKAVTLGRLARVGLPIPPGFVLTTNAFLQCVESVPAWKELESALAGIAKPDSSSIESISQAIYEVFGAQSIPVEVERSIYSALEQFPQVQWWAVRSSATAEDLPRTSFAGQHESFLNVPREEIPDRVRQCWASLFSPRAISYRIRNGIPHDRAAMAVIVQAMVPSEISGVLFTSDPTSYASGRLVIEAARGLGEKVVSGRVVPERLILAKPSLEIMERTPGQAPDGERPAASGAATEILDDVTARRLAKLSLRAEGILGSPLDIEWAVCHGEVYLLQARPITTKAPVRTWEDRQVWVNINTGEVFPDVTTPITWSVIKLLSATVIGSICRLVGADISRTPVVGLVAGRVYFNANTVLATVKPFSFLLNRVAGFVHAVGGGQIEAFRQAPVNIPPEDQPDLAFRWPEYILSWPRILYDLFTHSPRRGDAWIVRLETQLDGLVRLDVEAMSAPELVKLFTQLLRHGFNGWDLLYLVPQAIALPVFQKACRDWLEDPELALGYRLFSGLGDVPEAEAGLALWRLATLAHADRETESALFSVVSWPDALPKLQQTEHGRKFLGAWNVFMSEHGHHCRGELELFNARWSERPDYILDLVRSYLHSIDLSNPLENQRRLSEERRRLTEQCRRRLKNPIKRWIFLRSLGRAQKLAVNREKWKNEAVRQIAVLRRVLLILGQRLHERGILSERDDIFFLEVSEIEPVVTGSPSFNWRERIGMRRREYEKNLKLTPPPVVIGRFDPNARVEPAADASAECLQGVPVFPGIVTGRARVILRTDDHEQVIPGEILIAPFTDPAWTPYFITAAGVVMDQGGILSHGSIVAREYGLPAVTNVASATRVIRTGDLVQVDGNRGRVTIVERTQSK
jgi:pyruvate,water dikinase